MAMGMKRTCDVFVNVVEDVKPYVVVIYEMRDGKPHTNPEGPDAEVDLCPRALERLKKKIEQGTQPPVQRSK